MGTAIIVVIIGAIWAWIESGKKAPVTKKPEPKSSNMTMAEALQAQHAKTLEGPYVDVPVEIFYDLVGNQANNKRTEKPKEKPKPREKEIVFVGGGQNMPVQGQVWGQGHPVNQTLCDRNGNPIRDRNGNPITMILGNGNNGGNGGYHHG